MRLRMSLNCHRIARYTSAKRDEISLIFDQPVAWDNALMGRFRLGPVGGKVTAGAANGKEIGLKLAAPSTASTISYVNGDEWNHRQPIIRGLNGIAALTFCGAPIASSERDP
jgi:hypothetical protein